METRERKRILVVDDEPLNIDILSELLRRDYAIMAAKDGEAALRRAQGDMPPDLILLDVMMPAMDGYEVCRRLKTDRATADIPVIFITAVTEDSDEAKGLELGAVDFISKPIVAPVVIARVRAQLALQDARRDVERQRDFVRHVFGRYMSESIIDMVLASPDALKLGGEKRRATVLICDLRNFTPLADTLDPEPVVSALNNYLSEMVSVVERWGGTIDNFMGDSMLVVFGVPVAEDGARRAAACALEMQRAMPALNARHRELGLPELGMGIGLNTGDVIVGNIGSSRLMKYSVIGAAVNLAARLQAMALSGQVLASAATVAEAGPSVTSGGNLRVQLRGFKDPVEVYDLLAVD